MHTVATLDLDTLEWLSPHLVLPDSERTWSSIAFGPTSSPKYGYVGNVGIGGPKGLLFKFGPLLRADPPCDPTGITIKGRTSRTNIGVVRSAAGRALLKSGHGAGRGPTVRYTVTLATRSHKAPGAKKNKTAAAVAAPFAPAGLVVTLPADVTYSKSRVSPTPRVAGAKRDKTVSAGVYDAATHTVTWPNAPLAARKRRKYTVWTKVKSTAVSPLTYLVVCPNCPQLATQSDVAVRVLMSLVHV